MKRRRVTEATASPPTKGRGKPEPAKDEEFVEAAASLTPEDVDYVRKHAGQRKQAATPQPKKGEALPPESKAAPAEGNVPLPESKPPQIEEKAPAPAQGQMPQPAPRPAQTPGHRHRAVARGKRAQIEHPWPEVGTVLEADYFGTHYTAEVIEAPTRRKLKSGRMIRVASGPAAGTEHASMSGAMEAATEHQRNEQALGRKGCLSGWDFWKWPGKEGGRN